MNPSSRPLHLLSLQLLRLQRHGWLLALGMLVAVCGAPRTQAAESSSMEPALREALSGAADAEILWDLPRWRDVLTVTYEAGGYAPLWFSNNRPTRAAQSLLQEVAKVSERGLLDSDYDALALTQRLGNTRSDRELAAMDVALSVTAARLASDLHSGRVQPKEVGHDLDIPQADFDVGPVVRTLAQARDVTAELNAIEPQLQHYGLLKTMLAKYRELAVSDLPTNLPPLPSRSLRQGDVYQGAQQLRTLLTALGDLPADALPSAQSDVFDATLAAGLKTFQARHGLDADGVLGQGSFTALTTSMARRVQQIELSLERMRWLPPRLPTPPIIVNVPQFRMFAFRTTQDLAADILQMDVIVGSIFQSRRTPVFTSDMSYVVLNPYWDIPRSIMRNELLPQMRADPGYASRNGYEIVRGGGDNAPVVPVTEENMDRLARGELRLRQRPGPRNALGRMKFMFPNQHNVYLHDTPSRGLFSRSQRALSHGCIRVADPMALMAHVLRNDPSWTPERIEEVLASGKTQTIRLKEPIRVYIMYGTALAMEAGDIQFFEDLYGHDAALSQRLQSRRARAAG